MYKKLLLFSLLVPTFSVGMYSKSSGKVKTTKVKKPKSGRLHRTNKSTEKLTDTDLETVEQKASSILVEQLEKNGFSFNSKEVAGTIPLLAKLPVTDEQRNRLEDIYKQELGKFSSQIASTKIQEGAGSKVQCLLALHKVLENLRTNSKNRIKSGSLCFDSEDSQKILE